MSIGQVTLAEAAKGTWTALWKGTLWAACIYLACYIFGVEFNWRITSVCIVSSFFDYMIYSPRIPTNTSGDRGGK